MYEAWLDFCRVIFWRSSYFISIDSLIFTTEHLFFFLRKGEKNFQTTPLKRFRVRGLVIFREGVSTLNIHSILWEPLDFIQLLAYNLLVFFFLFKGRKVIKKKKRDLFIYIFYWFGRTRSFAYVPVRDQNLVVRGRNCRLICCVFFY